MTVEIDGYHRNLLRYLLRQVKQAASELDVELVCELCDDIQAVFAARPEVYELRPDTSAPESGPRAA